MANPNPSHFVRSTDHHYNCQNCEHRNIMGRKCDKYQIRIFAKSFCEDHDGHLWSTSPEYATLTGDFTLDQASKAREAYENRIPKEVA